MSKKLWVEYITTSKTFGPSKVSIDGCSDVDDFKYEIKKIFFNTLSSYDTSHLTLYKSDGTTEIDVEDSPSLLVEGNTRRNPLIVRIVGIDEKSSTEIVPKTSPSKVALVLRSGMTIEEKESILMDFLQSKEREVQSKEREVEGKVSLIDALEEKNQRIEAERDFLKGTLDARHIFEAYELRFSKPNPKGPRPTRVERWKNHLKLNPNILKKLEECNHNDEQIVWQDKAAEVYEELCRNIHQRTIDNGNGKYILMIEKSLPKTSSCFVKVLAMELYGDNVVVQEET